MNSETLMDPTNDNKLRAEIGKLMAETMRLQAETAKLQGEAKWYPFVVLGGVFGAAVALVKLLPFIG